MSHSCSFCGDRPKRLIPSIEDNLERERGLKTYGKNRRYSHQLRAWKNKKVSRQWARHLG